jgi:hypothetical protein
MRKAECRALAHAQDPGWQHWPRNLREEAAPNPQSDKAPPITDDSGLRAASYLTQEVPRRSEVCKAEPLAKRV